MPERPMRLLTVAFLFPRCGACITRFHSEGEASSFGAARFRFASSGASPSAALMCFLPLPPSCGDSMSRLHSASDDSFGAGHPLFFLIGLAFFSGSDVCASASAGSGIGAAPPAEGGASACVSIDRRRSPHPRRAPSSTTAAPLSLSLLSPTPVPPFPLSPTPRFGWPKRVWIRNPDPRGGRKSGGRLKASARRRELRWERSCCVVWAGRRATPGFGALREGGRPRPRWIGAGRDPANERHHRRGSEGRKKTGEEGRVVKREKEERER